MTLIFEYNLSKDNSILSFNIIDLLSTNKLIPTKHALYFIVKFEIKQQFNIQIQVDCRNN